MGVNNDSSGGWAWRGRGCQTQNGSAEFSQALLKEESGTIVMVEHTEWLAPSDATPSLVVSCSSGTPGFGRRSRLFCLGFRSNI